MRKEEKDEANLLRNRLDHEIDEFNLHISEILEKLEKKTQLSINLAKQHEEEVLLLSLISTAAALVLGLSYALIMSTGFVRPIQKLSSEVSRISSGKLDVEVNATSWDEIGQLSDAFQYMVDELKEKQQIEETFGKYVDPRIVKVIAASRALRTSSTILTRPPSPISTTNILRSWESPYPTTMGSWINSLAPWRWAFGARRLPSLPNIQIWPSRRPDR